jgi:hypothetical protein
MRKDFSAAWAVTLAASAHAIQAKAIHFCQLAARTRIMVDSG